MEAIYNSSHRDLGRKPQNGAKEVIMCVFILEFNLLLTQ